MLTKTSKELEQLIYATFQKLGGSHHLFTLDVTIFNSETNYEHKLKEIQGLNIAQMFIDNFTDHITIEANMYPLHILEAIDNAQDLKCSMIMTPHQANTFLAVEEGIIIKEYRAIIHNLEDFSKMLNIKEYKQFRETGGGSTIQAMDVASRIPVTFQLLEEKIYQKRHTKLNNIFRDGTTVEQAIQWILNTFEIEQIQMSTITNTYPFSNLKIPPAHGLDSVFDFIHRIYGIYDKGFSFYFCEDIAYLWPIYDHQFRTATRINLLSAPGVGIDSGECYHYVEESDPKDITIVSLDKVELSSPSMRGAEDVGNTHSQVSGDTIVDQYSRVDIDGSFKLNSDTTMYVQNTNNTLHKKTSNNMTHNSVGTNPYILSSSLASYSGVTFNCNWKRAVPYLLYPTESVLLQYDDKDGIFTQQKGILNSVIYQTVQIDRRVHNQPFFTFNASLSFWLEPEPKTETSSDV